MDNNKIIDKKLIDEFIEYAKKEYGLEFYTEKSDNPDTFESIFGVSTFVKKENEMEPGDIIYDEDTMQYCLVLYEEDNMYCCLTYDLRTTWVDKNEAIKKGTSYALFKVLYDIKLAEDNA